jgi:hypothetical protein
MVINDEGGDDFDAFMSLLRERQETRQGPRDASSSFKQPPLDPS